MPTFSPGAIVRVPFPHADSATRQYRPAVVVSTAPLGAMAGLLWVVMVTSAENRRWPGDVSLEADHAAMGLPAPSLARTEKIATIEIAHAELRGTVPDAQMQEIRSRLRSHLGLE